MTLRQSLPVQLVNEGSTDGLGLLRGGGGGAYRQSCGSILYAIAVASITALSSSSRTVMVVMLAS